VTALFEVHYPGLVRLAVLLLGNQSSAEDIVQDSFIKLHRRWRFLRDPDRAVAYLRTAVVNGSRSRGRRISLERRHSLVEQTALAPSAESSVLAAAEADAVWAAITDLPQRQREVMVLRYWLDLPEAQIASTLGISAGSVKTHASRALASLGRELGERP
jgi:RNA polymerase sigma-70 factor (sigma-E family)